MLVLGMASLTSKEFRRQNVERLADHWEAQGKRLTDLAAILGMSPSYFSQLKSGARGIGDKVARKIESALGWPRAALDHAIGPPGMTGLDNFPEHWPTMEQMERSFRNVVEFPDRVGENPATAYGSKSHSVSDQRAMIAAVVRLTDHVRDVALEPIPPEKQEAIVYAAIEAVEAIGAERILSGQALAEGARRVAAGIRSR